MNMKTLGILVSLAATFGTAHASLVSEWLANGNTNDSVGPNNGTAVGSVGYTSDGHGTAFNLNGSSWVDVASPSSGLESASGFTVAAWITMTQQSSGFGEGSIMNLRTPANDSGFTLEESAGGAHDIQFYVHTDVGSKTINTTDSSWQFNHLYMVAASYDAASQTMKLYRDGSLVASDTVAGTHMKIDAGSDFQIGHNIDPANGSGWFGSIGDARFYDTALSDGQVHDLVTPEPFSMALIGASALLGFRRMRRKKG